MTLTPEEVEHYRREGFAGPVRGWSEEEAGAIRERLVARIGPLASLGGLAGAISPDRGGSG